MFDHSLPLEDPALSRSFWTPLLHSRHTLHFAFFSQVDTTQGFCESSSEICSLSRNHFASNGFKWFTELPSVLKLTHH